VQLVQELEKEMNKAAANKEFESAAKKRNALMALKSLRARIIFSDRENIDLSNDHALHDISQLLQLPTPPKRIEGYDISHMSGTDTVASMVVFTNGIADKGAYRKFKMQIPGNDDFAHMNEVITRRLRKNNQKAWQLPDIFLIDGGKGQLSAALAARDAHNIATPMIGLAKKFEEIVIHKQLSNVQLQHSVLTKLHGYISEETDEFIIVSLPHTAHLIKLLQRIRDESHRFAVSYHSTLKVARQTQSVLEEIPGLGAVTKKKLLRAFGSVRGVAAATEQEISTIIGPSLGRKVYIYLKNESER
jgi:excinuclease ABC subunit C